MTKSALRRREVTEPARWAQDRAAGRSAADGGLDEAIGLMGRLSRPVQ